MSEHKSKHKHKDAIRPKKKTDVSDVASDQNQHVDAVLRAYVAPNSLNSADANTLQRTIGNQAVGQLLQRNSDGDVPAQGKNPAASLAAIVQRAQALNVQAKLTVGAVDDAQEVQADQVAKRVVAATDATVQRQEEDDLALKRVDQAQRQEEDELDMSRVNRVQSGKTQGGDPMLDGGLVDRDIEADINQAKGGGQPLDDNVRQPMESAFNADFGNVKVHTDSRSDELNRSVSAKAFTTGSDIFFRSGEYSPGSSSGKELIAHELTHVVQQGGAVSAETVQRQDDPEVGVALTHFLQRYNTVTTVFDQLQIEMRPRMVDFMGQLGTHTLEDYTDYVFGNTKIMSLLSSINESLATSGTDGKKVAQTIGDMLLFTSLIPNRKTEIKRKVGRSRFTRQAAEVMSPDRLADVLIGINQQLNMGLDPVGGHGLSGIDLDDKDSAAQRMQKLALTSAVPAARRTMQNDPLFQNILKSPDLLNILSSSTGAIEQRFLNTCAAAAINQVVQSQVIDIAGLLQVGSGVIEFVRQQIRDMKVDELEKDKLEEKTKGKMSLEHYANSRVNGVELAFTEIRLEAEELVRQPKVDTVALQVLTQRWSMQMQKLSGVADLYVGAKKMPVLTNKVIREQWNASAFLALGTGFDRGKRRKTPIEAETYMYGINKVVRTGQDSETRRIDKYLGKEKRARRQKLSKMWDRVFTAGGAQYTIPGHALYMKAILRGTLKTFAVGDPLIDKYEFYDIADMDGYLRRHKKLGVDIRVIRPEGQTLAYVKQNSAPLYADSNRLRNDIRMRTLSSDVIFDAVNDLKNGSCKVDGFTADGEKFSGMVRTSDIVMMPDS